MVCAATLALSWKRLGGATLSIAIQIGGATLTRDVRFFEKRESKPCRTKHPQPIHPLPRQLLTSQLRPQCHRKRMGVVRDRKLLGSLHKCFEQRRCGEGVTLRVLDHE